MLENEFHKLEEKQEIRTTISQIRKEIKKQDSKKAFLELLQGKESMIVAFLSDEDAKTRKNTALLIGDLKLEQAKEALIAAYLNETTLYVKSAYLTALGKLDVRENLEFFKNRLLEVKNQQVPAEEQKHQGEEIRELNEIILKTEGAKKHQFTGFQMPHEMLLLTNREQREVTLSEVKEIGASVQRKTELHPLGVLVFSKEVTPFTKLRTYRELLFPIHTNERIPAMPHRAAELLWHSDLYAFLTECHEGDAPFFFRLEVKSAEPKTEFVKKLGASLEKKSDWKLANSTTDYEIEIRLIEAKDGSFVPFLKLYSMKMKRFAYRKNAIAMSIHPATAAMLMYLAKPYLKENAQILDPCCGVGTMLIERDILVPAREKYGIDIFGDAIDMARENAALAGEKINFIHRDYFDFKHDYKFDEIVTNMPVKGKKAKEDMDAFYARFFEKSKSLLAEDGIIIMYSNEVGFVKKQLRLQPCYRLIQEYTVRKKDSYCLFIIGMK